MALPLERTPDVAAFCFAFANRAVGITHLAIVEAVNSRLPPPLFSLVVTAMLPGFGVLLTACIGGGALALWFFYFNNRPLSN